MSSARLMGALLICSLFLGMFSMLFPFVPLAKASIIWSDGFESGDFSGWSSKSGSVTVGTSHVYTGTYSAHIALSSGQGWVSHDEPGLTELHFSSHYYLDDLGLNTSEVYPDIPRICIMDILTNGPMGVELWVEWNSGSYYWRVRYVDGYLSGLIGTVAPAVGNWYGLELEWNHTGMNSGVTFWVNGTQAFSYINPDVYSSSTDSVDLGAFSYWGSQDYTWGAYFDDGVLGDAYLGCPGVGGSGGDTDPPAFSGSPAYSSNVATESSNITATATDNVGLSGYILSYSDTFGASYTNKTWKAASGTSATIFDSFTIPWAATNISKAYALFYVNDTTNNWATSTELNFYIANNTVVVGTLNAYNDLNSPGSRRIFRSSRYWVAVYADYATARVYASTSRDGVTFGSETTLNYHSLGEDEQACWAAIVWHSYIYLLYYNGSYSFSFNQTDVHLAVCLINENNGQLTAWPSEALFIDDVGGGALDPLIVGDWPDVYGGLIYGYYTFSFAASKDNARLYWSIRCLGGFSTYTSRHYVGYLTGFASNHLIDTPHRIADSDYDTTHMAIQADPYYDTGFLWMCDGDNDWIYYTRYDGDAWKIVNGRVDVSWEPLVSATDWSTTAYPAIGRTYLSSLTDTWYFPNSTSTSASFIEGGVDVSAYDTATQIQLGHTETSIYAFAVIGKDLYYWIKTGITPGVEIATWLGPTLAMREAGTLSKVSTTDVPGTNNAIGILYGNSTNSYAIVFGELGGDERMIVDASLDVEGCGNWVFVNERYYNWTLIVWHAVNADQINLAQIGFSVNTRQGLVRNVLSYDTVNWTVSYEPSNITDYNIVPVRTVPGNVSYSSDWSTAYFQFKIYFTQDCLDEYLNGFDFQARVTDLQGYDTGWNTIISRAFKIYNKGGFSIGAYTTGPAGINVGKTPFSFWAQNLSYAYNDLYYRDLVHIKLCPSVVALLGRSTFYLTYGLDYCIQGDSVEWVTGIKVILGAVAVTIGSERWWNWTVSWFYQGNFVRQDTLMTFERAGIHIIPYEDSSLVAECKLWVDLWFDNANGSTVVAGRVAAFEWPMTNSAPEYVRYLNSNWGPMDDQPTSSEFLASIMASDNSTVEPSAKIKMIKYWSSVEVPADDEEQLVYVLDFNVWDLTFSQPPFPPLTGIQTPVFDPPNMPDMPGGGFMGALFSGIQYLGKMLGDNMLFGGLGIWPTFVAFLDTVAGLFGAPGGFTNLMAWLSANLSYLWVSLSYVGSLFLSIFLFLASILDYIILLVAQAVLTFANIITSIVSMLTGAYGTGANLWEALGIWNWIMVGLIVYPIYLVILWDEEGFDAVINQLMFLFNVLNMLAHFFMSFIQMILGAIHTVVEAIPVVE